MSIAMQGRQLQPHAQDRTLTGRQKMLQSAQVRFAMLGRNNGCMQRLPYSFSAGPAEQLLGFGVPVRDNAAGIDGYKCVGRRSDDLPRMLFTLAQAAVKRSDDNSNGECQRNKQYSDESDRAFNLPDGSINFPGRDFHQHTPAQRRQRMPTHKHLPPVLPEKLSTVLSGKN